MRGVLSATYSACVYFFFFAVFLYAIGFVENLVVPKGVDDGNTGPLGEAIAIDLLLLGLFGVQHSVMARPAFKRALTKIVPESAERSTYVLCASAALALLFWQWRPMPQLVWSIEDEAGAAMILALSFAGWGMVLVSTFLISHFHLFGLTQGFARLLKLKPGASETHLVTPLFYKWMRHPIYAGFIVAFWAAPEMSAGRLLFAAGATAYIFVGIFFEERDLVAHFGERYREYRRKVGMFWPKGGAVSLARRTLI